MPSSHEIVLVAAMGKNRVIGVDGGMPWHLPADLKHFKAVTMGHPVVTGRRNVVLSRSLDPAPAGCEVADSLDEALDRLDQGPVMVIGGGELYRTALPVAYRMELTFIDTAPEGDTHFPNWNKAQWSLAAMSRRPADAENPYALVFCSLSRAVAPE